MAKLYPFKNLMFTILIFLYLPYKTTAIEKVDTLKIEDGPIVITYTMPGMIIETEGNFIEKVTSSILLLLPSESFKRVLLPIMASNHIITISNRVPVDHCGDPRNALAFNGFPTGGGIIMAGLSQETFYISHELFHAYQHKRRGPQIQNCVCYEFDAFLFQTLVAEEAGILNTCINDSETAYSRIYNEAFNSLMYLGWSTTEYTKGITFFKHSSPKHNALYKNLPICSDSYFEKPLIREFIKP